MQPIFKELFDNTEGVKGIAKVLQEKFPKQRGDDIYKMAIAFNNQFTSYQKVLGDTANKNEVIAALSTSFAQQFAQEWRNENIEKIVDE